MEPRDADPWNLVRFLRAQVGMHDVALRELRAGRKTGHWIWYEFPQLAGLGSSSMTREFAISGLDEARAYLAHPVLRARLEELCEALLIHRGRSAEAILGPMDARKVRSSMTLFLHADPSAPLFRRVLDAFYDGETDPRTDQLLGPERANRSPAGHPSRSLGIGPASCDNPTVTSDLPARTGDDPGASRPAASHASSGEPNQP